MTGLRTTLRSLAQRLPDVEQGVACEGTPLESITYRVRKKAFLFVGATAARLKLQESLAEANELATRRPGIEAGSGGWVKLDLDVKAPPAGVLQRWVAESYALFAGPQTTTGGSGSKKPRARKRAGGR